MRRLNEKEAKKILAKVPLDVSFWLCTNHYLRGLRELSTALESISDDTFRYHVNRDKNDFEVWIRQIVKDKELSREISRIKTKETLVRKVSERVEELLDIVKKAGPVKKARKKAKRKKPGKKKTKKKTGRIKKHKAVKTRKRKAKGRVKKGRIKKPKKRIKRR